MDNDEVVEALTGTQQRYYVKRSGQNQLVEPSAIDLPLPSLGILYRDDPSMAPVHDGMIQVRPMTMRELELFLKPELNETGTLIDALFSNCIKTPIDPKKLLVSDRTFILLWLRSESFGSEYRFKFRCGNCGKNISHRLDLGDLDHITLDNIHGEIGADGKVKASSIKKIKEPFEFKLLRANKKVYFRLARGYDESSAQAKKYYDRLDNDRKKKLQKLGMYRDENGQTVIRNIDPTAADHNDADTYIDEVNQLGISERMLKQIVRIEDISEDHYEDFIKNLIAGDVSDLQEAMYNSDSGVDLQLHIECPNPECRHVNSMAMPFTESFFRSSL